MHSPLARLARRISASAALLLCTALAAPPAAAQSCAPQWRPFDPSTSALPGLDKPVYTSTLWDPDGPGPANPKLVIAGDFTVAGNAVASRIALYDLDTGEWSALGAGFNNFVFALATLPDGSLVAGGDFTASGSQPLNHVARWDGSQWVPLGAGVDGRVWSFLTLPSGDLVVGGKFNTVGGQPATNVARWNGSTWSAMGAGLGSGSLDLVRTLAMIHGELYAGGAFNTSGSTFLSGIARWNGAAWVPFATPLPSIGYVYSLAPLPSGGFVVGGYFRMVTSATSQLFANNIAIWNGADWAVLDYGLDNGYEQPSASVFHVSVLPDGRILAAGNFQTSYGAAADRLAIWDGAHWNSLASSMTASGIASVATVIPLPDNNLFVAGSFNSVGSNAAKHAAFFNLDTNTWAPLTRGLNENVLALASLPAGDVVAAGAFTHASAVQLNGIGRWNGLNWSPLGQGFNNTVSALATIPNSSSLIAGGSFTSTGTLTVNHVARWNGATWSPLGLGVNNPVRALLALPNGDIIVGGEFTQAGGSPANRIARWNGATWSPMGLGLDGDVRALARTPDGSIYAAGAFLTSGSTTLNRVARWDGANWLPLSSGVANGPGAATVYALKALPDGRLIAGGTFVTAGSTSAFNIAIWNGSSWAPLGPGVDSAVFALTSRLNGDLIVGGFFSNAGGAPASRVARWDGANWFPIDQGLSTAVNSGARALLTVYYNDIVIGGQFTSAGPLVTPYLARWGGCPPCPGDANADNTTNFADLNLILTSFGQAVQPGASGDLNNDGLVDFTDLNSVLSFFGLSC